MTGIPNVPYADPSTYQFLLQIKKAVEALDALIVSETGQVDFGSGNTIRFNTTTNAFEFYKAGLLVHSI